MGAGGTVTSLLQPSTDLRKKLKVLKRLMEMADCSDFTSNRVQVASEHHHTK